MRVAFTVGMVSIVAVAVMAETAVADGFSVLVFPLLVLEVFFLAAVYVLWQALGGRR